MSQYSPYTAIASGPFSTFPDAADRQSDDGATTSSQQWDHQSAFSMMVPDVQMQAGNYPQSLLEGKSGLSPHHTQSIHSRAQRSPSQSQQQQQQQQQQQGDLYLDASPTTAGVLQSSSLPENRMPDNYNHAMANFVVEDGPWVIYRNPNQYLQVPPGRSRDAQDIVSRSSGPDFGVLRHPSYSKAASDGGGPRPATDSGYGTTSARSVGGPETPYFNPDCSGIPSHFETQSMYEPSQQQRYVQHRQQPQQQRLVPSLSPQTRSRPRSKSQASKEGAKKCEHCDYHPTCPSDLKKHLLKHVKNYRCTYPGCKRQTGFGTQNDLDRHEKSVHHIGVANTKNYRCAARNCAKATKLWPRLDNFKSHLTRMHPDEDMNLLLANSEIQPVTNAPDNTDHVLAGIGTDMNISPSAPSADLTISPDRSKPNMLNFGDGVVATAQADGHPSSTSHESNLDPRLTDQLPKDVNQLSKHIMTNFNENQIIYLLGGAAANLQSGPTTPMPRPRPAGSSISMNRRLPGRELKNTNTVQSTEEITISRAEAIRALTRLASVLKAQKVDRISPSGMHKKVKLANGRPCTFSGCSATFPRECELTKHLKRHNRPYGCTFPKCPRVFGSKSDWKRHENSQHFQLEMWRCMLDREDGKQCAKVAYEKDAFMEHLKEGGHRDGPTDEAAREDLAKKYRVGRNGQTRFWCGFCRKIIELKAKGTKAWDERFNHIDGMHFKNGERTLTWLCFEENRTKQEIEQSMDRTDFGDEDPSVSSTPEETAVETDDASRSTTDLVDPQVTGNALTGRRPKRKAEADSQDGPRKKANLEYVRNCCHCQNGPYSMKLYASCLLCSHQICDDCALFVLDDGPELDLDIYRYKDL